MQIAKERAGWRDKRFLRGIANYQFGGGIGDLLISGPILVTLSRKTGRIRQIYRSDKLIATLRPSDGLLALTPDGARIIVEKARSRRNIVMVNDDAARFVEQGRNVFAKHVVHVDDDIRPMEEVLVTDKNGVLLAVGRTVLTGREIRSLDRGVAVKVRRGVAQK